MYSYPAYLESKSFSFITKYGIFLRETNREGESKRDKKEKQQGREAKEGEPQRADERKRE